MLLVDREVVGLEIAGSVGEAEHRLGGGINELPRPDLYRRLEAVHRALCVYREGEVRGRKAFLGDRREVHDRLTATKRVGERGEVLDVREPRLGRRDERFAQVDGNDVVAVLDELVDDESSDSAGSSGHGYDQLFLLANEWGVIGRLIRSKSTPRRKAL